MSSQDDDVTDVGEYKPGSVQRIKLSNFLTYAEVEVLPGPRLNMVCGPNGTGKSTILCAICLGLGGQPRNLGRADDARAFIMHEENKATIEIELTPFPGKETHVFRRKIDRDKGSERGKGRGASTFYINGQKVKIEDVQKLVKETYHITIDNLCTFMPQEKVGNFSALDQQQLLVETEKTFSGTQHLFHTHEKLIELEKELNSDDSNVETIEAKLAKLKVELERFEREKERMEEREEAIRMAELLEMKIIWLRFNDLREQLMQVKEKKANIKKALKEATEQVRPLEERAEALKEQRTAAEKEHKRLDQVTQKHKKEMEKQATKYQTHDEEIETVLLELKEVDNKRHQKEIKLQQAREAQQKIEINMENLPPYEQIESDYARANEDRAKISQAYKRAKAELQELEDSCKDFEEKANSCSMKLSKLQDAKAQRRQHVLRNDEHLGAIMEWLGPNRNKFRRPVWGPVAAEVAMKSENSAAFLEQHVPNAILKAFVVECKEDYDLLYTEVRKKMKKPINITLVRNGELKPIKRMYSEQKFEILRKEHGIIGYMDESFDAPDPVKQALISAARVHQVLIGGDKTQHSIDEKGLLDFLGKPEASLGQQGTQGSCICATMGPKSFKYTTQVSRHNKKTFMQQDDIMPAKMLRMGTNDKQKKDLETKLQQYHDEIAKLRPGLENAGRTKTKLEEENAAIHKKLTVIKDDKETFMKLRTKVTNAKRKVKNCEEDLKTDDKTQKEALIREAMNRINGSISALEAHAATHNKMMKSTFSSAGARVEFDALKDVERRAWQECEEKQQEFEEISRKAAAYATEYAKVRNALQTAKTEADARAPLVDAHGKELPLKAALEDLPVETLEDAEVALEEANQKVKSIHEDPNVIKQYEDTVKAIAETEKILKDKQGSKEALNRKIEHLLGPWETAITNSIDKVNSLFTHYMREAGCVGEVRLTKGATYDDGGDARFKDWGVEIRVSFRENQKPQVLSSRVQSGGERALSTIMYLMALQEMMVSPFRCVDEINQGLDDRNERLVFKRIVENSTRPPRSNDPTNHTGQYFLITPKLLPNLQPLEDSDGITVLIVFNGESNFDSPQDWARFLAMKCNADNGDKRRAIAASQQEDENEEENDENAASSPIPRRGRKKRRS